MKIAVRDIGDIAILDLAGKLTRGDGDELLRVTVEGLLAAGRNKIVVNLEGVPYMDSAGMGELVAVRQRTAKADGAVRLMNPLKRVYDVLQMVKLDTIFEIYQEETKAVASLR